MKLTKLLALIICLYGFQTVGFSQKRAPIDEAKKKSFSKTFSDADFHVINNNYYLALQLYLNLYNEEPENANLNYKVGFCYMNIPGDKLLSIPYLEKAVQNVSERYLEFESDEKHAPLTAYYYMAKAYHYDYKFDKAIEYFEKYRTYIRPKDTERLNDIDLNIAMCKNGKELIKTPVNIKITNLGDSINSAWPDYAPGVTADEGMIIFTSRREGTTGGRIDDDGQYYEDIYISHKKDDGTWEKAQPVGENINTADHDASVSVSSDGNLVFIYKPVKSKHRDGDIYVSRLNGDIWSVPEKLGSDINTKYWETHACISANGQELFFVSDRPGGFGGRDIYRCVKLPNGEWSKAQNMGPIINTPYDEDGVFFHPNEKDLYFSSIGHGSMGGFDVFMTTRKEDGSWTKPENLGYPINSTDDDIFFVTSADGKRAYYSSDQAGGFGEKDIYMVELDRKEADVTLMVGRLVINGQPKVGDNTITVTTEENGEVYAISKARSNGKYVLTLPPGKTYLITYEVPGFAPHVEKIVVPAGTGYNEIRKEILIKPIGFEDPEQKALAQALAEKQKAAEAKKAAEAQAEANKAKDANNSNNKSNESAKATGNNKEFTHYFTYNKNVIDDKDADFIAFVNYLTGELKAGKTIKLEIIASASTVPTKLFGNNKELAKVRAKKGKDFLESKLKETGVE
ncbi:MAG: PD40 domain-containing protein, partial [Bacteroidia bacterium]|nr:PD40 domain-containing protein [Bacteroidia bacterium]